MRLLCLITCILTLFLQPTYLSLAANSAESAQTLYYLGLVLESIESKVQSRRSCVLPSSFYETPICSSQTICNLLSQNIDRSFIYKSPSGGKIPNFQLLISIKNLNECQREKEQQTYSDSKNIEKQERLKKLEAFLKDSPKDAELFEKLKSYIATKILNGESVSEFDFFITQSGTSLRSSKARQEKIEAVLKYIDEQITAPDHFSNEAKELFISYIDTALNPLGDTQGKEKNPSQTAIRTGFFDVKDLYDLDQAGSKASLQKNIADYEKKFKKASLVFEKAKISLIQVLEQKKMSHPSPAFIDKAIQKISSIPLSGFPLNESGLSACALTGNAFYHTQKNQVFICPQFLTYPEMSLSAVFAHELAHAIDPCNFTKDAPENFSLYSNSLTCLSSQLITNTENGLVSSEHTSDNLNIVCAKESPIQEAWADLTALQTLTLDLKRFPLHKRAEKSIEWMLPRAIYACASVSSELESLAQKAAKLNYCSTNKPSAEENAEDGYFDSALVVDRVYFSSDTIKNELGCSTNEPKACPIF